MASRLLIPVALCLAALPLAGATAQPEKINGLLNNSPFGQSRAGTAAAAGSGDPLEFRAVLEDKGSMMFSIYDTVARRSTWVPLKDSSNGFAVNDYDAAKESITVDFHGRVMTLPIKRAPMVAVAQGPRPNMPGGPAGAISSLPPGMAPGSPVDQQRMQQIQEEIRRRRALREQPAGTASPAGIQPGPMPMTSPNGVSVGPQAIPSNSSGPQPIPPKP